MQSSVTLHPKIIRTTKDQPIACTQCTFLNGPDATQCGMCAADIKPPTHIVQSNGMWKCGSCETLNQKGIKTCHNPSCKTSFSSTIISTAPSQIFCSRCGFLNDGENSTCVQCDLQLLSTLEKMKSELTDSTNVLARDMGMNMNIKCPGCQLVCFVPPATAGLRCGTCHTYFASPTVGEMTNFHMTRLASSISSSFRGFFRRTSDIPPMEEVPIGRLIAIGELAQCRKSSTEGMETTLESSASFELHEEEEEEEEDDDEEEKAAAVEDVQEEKAAAPVDASSVSEEVQIDARVPVSPRKPARILSHAMAIPVALPTSPHKQSHRIHTKTRTIPTALSPFPLDDVYEVEGEIVEL